MTFKTEFVLNKKLFDLLTKEVPEAQTFYKLISKSNDSYVIVVEDEDLLELQFAINCIIVSRGMNNQDTVNALGIELYALYDEILYQID